MKKLMISLCTGLIITAAISSHFNVVESSLTNSVVRLHIIAESNKKDDQMLKLKVRDAIIKSTKDIFTTTCDINTAKLNIKNNIDYIKKVAEDEITKNGYDYKVNVSFGKSDFPTKAYNNVTLPSGFYDALKIEIGNAKGENWWCVMFPPLCFVNGSTGELDKNGKAYFESVLSSEEMNLISNEKEFPIDVEFKLYELWQSGKSKLKELIKK